MTNNLKPFDIEAAKRGEPVVTRDGRKARIVCFDRNADYPIICLVQVDDTGFEDAACLNVNGMRYLDGRGHERDLFMADPSIHEGFTPYDPNVPPPENAELFEVLYSNNTTLLANTIVGKVNAGTPIAYRVTKWKEAKPSLDDIEEFVEYLAISLDNPKQDVLEVVSKFADAIVQLAVDKSRKDRG